MKLIVLGTGPFAVPTFQALLQSPHQVRALVTKPIDDPGRRKSSPNPMRDAAHAAGIEVQSPANANDPPFVGWLRAQAVDALVVCDYGQILSADCLATARLGGINLHGSLLPRHRGAAPVQWAIYYGDSTSGVSVIHLTGRLDAGPILAQVPTPIGPRETAEQLEQRLAEMGVAAVFSALSELERWDGRSFLGRRQDQTAATRAPRIRKEQGAIDWSRSARQLFNQIRAFYPWPGSFTQIVRAPDPPLRIIVHEAQVVETAGRPPPPGSILESAGGRMVVACGENALDLLRVQPAGKRVMSAAEFLRGYPLPPGTRLG